MTSPTPGQVHIETDPDLPTIRITRDFAAPPERVRRAWTDPALAVRWQVAKRVTTQVTLPPAGPLPGPPAGPSTGPPSGPSTGLPAERAPGPGRPGPGRSPGRIPVSRLAQTCTYEATPDTTCLETVVFESLDPAHTRVTSLSVVDTLAHRDELTSRGLEQWIIESYRKLDALLATG